MSTKPKTAKPSERRVRQFARELHDTLLPEARKYRPELRGNFSGLHDYNKMGWYLVARHVLTHFERRQP